jgi:phosphohistidine phosphatase
MRRLILMRHAKSSWADPAQRDFDRPLNKRGRRSSALIGRWVRKKGYVPDIALVSGARRTRETWDAIVREAGPAETRNLPELYHAGQDTLLEVVRRAADVPCLLVLGHQPAIGAFAERLLAAPPDGADFAKFPTGATAVIDLDADGWGDVAYGTGQLVDFVVPRALE